MLPEFGSDHSQTMGRQGSVALYDEWYRRGILGPMAQRTS